MLKYANHDIVFQEFPDEVTLAVNLSCCPNGCPGCHSAWLQGDVGEVLTEERLWALAESYRGEVTCVALMGGDNDPETVMHLLRSLRRRSGDALRTGWYSGRDTLPPCFDPASRAAESAHHQPAPLPHIATGPQPHRHHPPLLAIAPEETAEVRR